MRNILSGRITPSFFRAPDLGEPPTRAGGKDTVHISKEAKKFGARFKPPPEALAKAGLPPSAPDPDPDPNAPPEGGDPKPPEGGKPPDAPKPPEERKKPGANVPQIVEAKRKAEAALVEKEAEIKKFTDEVVPGLNTQIDALKKKIESGEFSSTREAEFQKKIEKLEGEKVEVEQKMADELKKTRERLKVFDLASDPTYRAKYIVPMQESLDRIGSIIGGNQVLKQAVIRALAAQKDALNATSAEGRAEAERSRDTVLNDILEGMNPVQQRRFNAEFDKYIDLSESQAVALADNEVTARTLREENQNRAQEQAKAMIQEWDAEYQAQAPDFDKHFTLDDSIVAKMKELGLEVNKATEDKFAHGAIRGEHGKKDVVKLIHRGRAYGVLTAANQAQAAIIAELRKTITTLQGATPPPGSHSGPPPSPPKPDAITNTQGKTRAEWERERFKPPTA